MRWNSLTVRTQKNQLVVSGFRLVLSCLFLPLGFCFWTSHCHIGYVTWNLIAETLVGKNNHCCYFYIWNPNLIDVSGRELQLFKHVDFVCVSVQNVLVAMASQCMISVKVVLIESIKRWAQKNMFIKPFSDEIFKMMPDANLCLFCFSPHYFIKCFLEW